jgi:alpha-N-arabinofuranosidase
MKMIKSLLIFVLVASLAPVFSTAQEKKEFTNPILAGFYPDPSICKAGSNYYLITSSFAYFPGLPIFHSKDLVSWKQIGHVLDRPEQLNLDGHGVSRGLFAPSIQYHKGKFYVVCTLIDTGGNFVVTATDPAGPWSDPVWIPEVTGIDPSLYFENDKAYIVYNSVAPDDQPLYSGHRTLRMYEFDPQLLKVKDNEVLLVNGGVDLQKKPVWIEAPHIFKKDNFYYLIAAEGGTAYNHSEVVFRSASVKGPYIPYDKNPILTQRHLSRSRPNPVTTTGHADFVQTETGEWWAVFLGCRPYEDDYFNVGRETFLAPVQWKDGWPIINPDFETVQYQYPVPDTGANSLPDKPEFSGNYTFRDNFIEQKLGFRWMFLRTPRTQWHSIAKGNLTLNVRPETCAGKENPSFIGFRQAHHKGYASTSLAFEATSENEKAGLVVFQNENHFYYLCKSIRSGKPVVELYRSVASDSSMELITSREISHAGPVMLKIESNNNLYAFYYTLQPGKWNNLEADQDAKFLSTKTAGGFVGSVYALYATSQGKTSTRIAYFDWFEYTGNDTVYKEPGKK